MHIMQFMQLGNKWSTTIRSQRLVMFDFSNFQNKQQLHFLLFKKEVFRQSNCFHYLIKLLTIQKVEILL